jgi:hypothetical protein
MRLLQIEGPNFADNVVNTLEEEGIPRDKVEEVLIWAIGEDFHRIRLSDWPIRLQKKGLDIKRGDTIVGGLQKIARAWKEEN